MTEEAKSSKSAEVIQLRPLKATKASERKWGKAVMSLGFCIVPSLLLRAQRRLRLNPTQLAVLMHLADHWWDVDRKPFPSKKRLSDRLGIGPRQLQRHIAELERAGLVTRIGRTAPGRGKVSNVYDLAGLVKRLKELEPEVRAAEEQAKARQREVMRPGLRHRD